jgi:hypothetical protein
MQRTFEVVQRAAVNPDPSAIDQRPDGVSAHALGTTSDRPARSYGVGRTCRSLGCGTLLSRYNSTPWCAVHSHPGHVSLRAPRRRSAA